MVDRSLAREERSRRRAILYARVSTRGQVRSGYSLAQQREALTEYAAHIGYEVLEEVTDLGESGASLERPGMDRVRELVASGSVSVVLAQDLDRLAREPEHYRRTPISSDRQPSNGAGRRGRSRGRETPARSTAGRGRAAIARCPRRHAPKGGLLRQTLRSSGGDFGSAGTDCLDRIWLLEPPAACNYSHRRPPLVGLVLRHEVHIDAAGGVWGGCRKEFTRPSNRGLFVAALAPPRVYIHHEIGVTVRIGSRIGGNSAGGAPELANEDPHSAVGSVPT